MPYTFYPSIHTRKAYNPDWAHLDPQESLDVKAKAVFGKVIPDGYEYDDGYSYWAYLKFSRPMTRKEVIEACYDAFQRGCSCEHDCCGHHFGGACEYKQANRRGTKWAVCLHYAPNY